MKGHKKETSRARGPVLGPFLFEASNGFWDSTQIQAHLDGYAPPEKEHSQMSQKGVQGFGRTEPCFFGESRHATSHATRVKHTLQGPPDHDFWTTGFGQARIARNRLRKQAWGESATFASGWCSVETSGGQRASPKQHDTYSENGAPIWMIVPGNMKQISCGKFML